MNGFSFGRYVPFDSFVHRMDPRAKIFCVILLMVAIFLGFDTWAMTFTMAGLAFLLILFLLYCTRTSFFSVLNSLKGLWFMMLFLLVIYVVMPRQSDWVAFSLWGYPIYYDSLLDAAKIFVRLVMMIEITMILTASTKPLDLTYALEWYMIPLKIIRFPSHEVAMTISIALRFIPTLLDDTDRVMKAQSSRGVDFSHGHLLTRFRAITSLIVPLFVSAFMRSEELADAMECRGYNPKAKRTRYRLLKFRWLDLLETALVCGFFAVFIYVSVTHFDAYQTWWGLVAK